MVGGGGERQRQRDRETETDRDTETQTQRETETEIESETETTLFQTPVHHQHASLEIEHDVFTDCTKTSITVTKTACSRSGSLAHTHCMAFEGQAFPHNPGAQQRKGPQNRPASRNHLIPG